MTCLRLLAYACTKAVGVVLSGVVVLSRLTAVGRWGCSLNAWLHAVAVRAFGKIPWLGPFLVFLFKQSRYVSINSFVLRLGSVRGRGAGGGKIFPNELIRWQPNQRLAACPKDEPRVTIGVRGAGTCTRSSMERTLLHVCVSFCISLHFDNASLDTRSTSIQLPQSFQLHRFEIGQLEVQVLVALEFWVFEAYILGLTPRCSTHRRRTALALARKGGDASKSQGHPPRTNQKPGNSSKTTQKLGDSSRINQNLSTLPKRPKTGGLRENRLKPW